MSNTATDPNRRVSARRVLRVVGLSHRNAPLELRERVAVSGGDLPLALRALGDGVLLSTCNRTEIYRLTSPGDPEPAVEHFFAERLGPDADRHLYRLDHLAALRHLFAVAAGLDSLVLGEPQILGQLRAALDAASEAGAADALLARIFHQALRLGRRARAETFIGRHAVSVSYAAVELAREVLGGLSGASALVVGAGEMGDLTTRTLVEHGANVVAVANRTVANAAELADRVGGRAVSLEELPEVMAGVDIVVSSTDAPGYVVSRPMVEAAARQRAPGRPLLLVDIAVPRDVDPTIRDLAGVYLYDLDDLQALCDHNRDRRLREAHQVQRLIDLEVERFARWWSAMPALPAVIELRRRAEIARAAELEEALGKLRHLDPADRLVVDQLSRAIVNQLLHQPSVRLKELAAADDLRSLAVLRDALGLDPE